MSTANKLTYLNTTKGKIKDSINLTGANIGNNDTFRSYSAKLRDSLVDIINNGTDELYDNFPKATGTGSEIELNNTYEAPMGIDLKGNTHQDSYSGKNLCGFNFSANNLGIQANMSGSELTLNGTTTGRGIVYLNSNSNITLSAGTYTMSSRILNGTFNTDDKDTAIYLRKLSDNTQVMVLNRENQYTKTYLITLSEETTFYFHIFTNGSGFVFNNLKLGIQIEKGSTATDYEPYVGGTASPNPDYPQNIEVVTGNNSINICGKNLFDKDNFTNGFLYISKGTINTSESWVSNWNITDYIKINNNFTLSYATINNLQAKVGYYDENKSYISGVEGTYAPPYTFTIPNNAKYIRFNYRNNLGATDIQLEQGSTPTSYEPYSSDTYEINLGKNLFDDTIVQGVVVSTGFGDVPNRIRNTKFIKVTPGETYSLSFETTNEINQYNISYFTSDTFPRHSETGWINSSFTIPSEINYIMISFSKSTGANIVPTDISNVQLEIDSQRIELCKIGEYQDYIFKSEDKWYKYCEIKKDVFNGSENWSKRNDGDGNATITFQLSISNLGAYGAGNVYCNNFTYEQISSSGKEGIGIGNVLDMLYFQIKRDRLSSLDAAGFKNWLSNNNTTVYYVLATPTNTEITNTELISQLEAIKNAMSKKDKTYITAKYVEGNQPFKITTSALLREE